MLGSGPVHDTAEGGVAAMSTGSRSGKLTDWLKLCVCKGALFEGRVRDPTHADSKHPAKSADQTPMRAENREGPMVGCPALRQGKAEPLSPASHSGRDRIVP
jgi:hypothetical protein